MNRGYSYNLGSLDSLASFSCCSYMDDDEYENYVDDLLSSFSYTRSEDSYFDYSDCWSVCTDLTYENYDSPDDDYSNPPFYPEKKERTREKSHRKYRKLIKESDKGGLVIGHMENKKPSVFYIFNVRDRIQAIREQRRTREKDEVNGEDKEELFTGDNRKTENHCKKSLFMSMMKKRQKCKCNQCVRFRSRKTQEDKSVNVKKISLWM